MSERVTIGDLAREPARAATVSLEAVPPLAVELLRILAAEREYPPISADGLLRVLAAIGWSPLPSEEEIARALEALVTAGTAERRISTRTGTRYRLARPGLGMDPESA
jgi:hypothetical protein